MASSEERPKSNDKKYSRNIFTRFGRTISRAFHHKRRQDESHQDKRGDYRTKSSSELDREVSREAALSVSIDNLHHKSGQNQARCVSEGDLLAPRLFNRQESEDGMMNCGAPCDRKNFKSELSSKLLLRLNSSEDNRFSQSCSSSSSPLGSPAVHTKPDSTSGESGSIDFSTPTSDAAILDTSATRNRLSVARQRPRRYAPSTAVSQRISASSDFLTNIKEEENAATKTSESKKESSPLKTISLDAGHPAKKASPVCNKAAATSPVKSSNSVKTPPKLTPKPKSFIRQSDSDTKAPPVILRSTNNSLSSDVRISKSPSSDLNSSERGRLSYPASMSKSATLPVSSSSTNPPDNTESTSEEPVSPTAAALHFTKRTATFNNKPDRSQSTRPFSVHDSTRNSNNSEPCDRDSAFPRPRSKRHTIMVGNNDKSVLFTNPGKSEVEEPLSRTRQHQSLKLPDTKNQSDNEDLPANKRASTVLDLIKNFQNIQATT